MLSGMLGVLVAHRALFVGVPHRQDLEYFEGVLFDPAYASPWLVIVGFGLMIWSRWTRLEQADGEGAPSVGVAHLILGAGLCLWSLYTGARGLQVISLSVVVLGTGWYFGGRRAARTLTFPCLFLLLAHPIPAPLVNAWMYPLQLAMASAASWVLATAGYDIQVSGDLLKLGGHVFQVIETCSGMRTMMTVLVATCIYCEMVSEDRLRTAILIAVSPVVGGLANLARILWIILNPNAEAASDHSTQGLVMLVLAIVVICAIDLFLERLRGSKSRPEPPVSETRRPSSTSAGAAFAVMGASLAMASFVLRPWTPSSVDRPDLSEIRATIPGWSLSGFEPNFEFLGAVRFDEFIAHRYTLVAPGGTKTVELLVGSDRHLDPSMNLVSGKTRIPGPGGFELPIEPPLRGPTQQIEAALIMLPDGMRLVYHWRSGNRPLMVETMRAVLGLDRSFLRRSDRAAFVRLSTRVESLSHEAIAAAVGRLDMLTRGIRSEAIRAGIWATDAT